MPGHGPLIRREQIAEVMADHDEYYQLVQHLAAEGLRDGKTPLELTRGADLARFAAWPDAERLVPDVHRAYAAMSCADVDVPEALQDAVGWLGRPMRTSV